MSDAETVTIRHKVRFNGYDKGATREVSKADAKKWEGEKLCTIIKGKKAER